jgi:superoxide dismutase, Fe-Mn family
MTEEFPKLPYEYDALEPYIDAETMKIHHNKHHQGYYSKLMDALKDHPDIASKPINEILSNLKKVPEEIRDAVRNTGGGYANHTFFWDSMAPDSGGEPTNKIAEAITETFGNFDKFKELFSVAAASHFGSGWAWLVLDDNKLAITSTNNQNSPLSTGQTPIVNLDVWEHAYYLKYQNRRADYIDAWWNIVNWEEVEKRFVEAS